MPRLHKIPHQSSGHASVRRKYATFVRVYNTLMHARLKRIRKKRSVQEWIGFVDSLFLKPRGMAMFAVAADAAGLDINDMHINPGGWDFIVDLDERGNYLNFEFCLDSVVPSQ